MENSGVDHHANNCRRNHPDEYQLRPFTHVIGVVVLNLWTAPIQQGRSSTMSNGYRIAYAVEDKKPDCGGQVSLPTPRVDIRDHGRERDMLAVRNFFQPNPKRLFETDASLMPGYDDGPLDDKRFHCDVPMAARPKLVSYYSRALHAQRINGR